MKQVCVVGLGYVGLPLAVAFGKKAMTIGFDVNENRLATLKRGVDANDDVSSSDLEQTNIHFTTDPQEIKKADFVIVAVPTPIDENNKPDLSILESASKTVGENLKEGAIVVFESTVYPGTTEDVCVPIIEQASNQKCGEGFFVGYSPERINPGDHEHTFERITKVVSGMDVNTLEKIATLYESVVTAGVHKAESIKVAEAAKVIENTQRDVNIALMNELKMIFDKLQIDTNAVLEAAGTKWNFLKFYPGLVGGHCISVDPYYLAHKAQQLGHDPKMILAGRAINDDMAHYQAKRVLEKVNSGKLLILGATFKPDVRDLRNSKVKDVAKDLEKGGLEIAFHEPLIEGVVLGYKNLTLDDAKEQGFTQVLLAVRHKLFMKQLADIKKDFTIIELF